MKKTRVLTLIRHAKSSWENPGMSDDERPLAAKGLRDAPLIASHHQKLLQSIEHYYCSTAVRAQETLHEMLQAVSFSKKEISYLFELYTFDARRVIDVIHELPDHNFSLALVGHNPAFTEAVNYLADEDIVNMPTSAIAQIEFEISSWQKVNAGCGKLVLYTYPRQYR